MWHHTRKRCCRLNATKFYYISNSLKWFHFFVQFQSLFALKMRNKGLNHLIVLLFMMSEQWRAIDIFFLIGISFGKDFLDDFPFFKYANHVIPCNGFISTIRPNWRHWINLRYLMSCMVWMKLIWVDKMKSSGCCCRGCEWEKHRWKEES